MEASPGDALLVPQDLIDRVVPDDGHLALGDLMEQAVLEDLLRAQAIPAMDQRHVLGNVRQIEGFFHGGVAAADHGDALAAKEEAIAGSASRDAAPAIFLFGRQTEVSGRRSRRNDKRVARVVVRVAHELERTVRQIDGLDVIVDDLSGEALGVTAHAVHQSRSLQALDVPRPVVDLRRGHELATLLDTGDQQRMAIRARCVHRRAVACGARSNDDQAAMSSCRHE